MKKIIKTITALLTAAMMITLAGCTNNKKETTAVGAGRQFNIVSSFYPMHILTMNLTKGIKNVNAKSMSDPNMGCIHDHTFTTEDLKKIENADVYVENGLGLEAFNEKIKEAYPKTKIIEASKNVTDYKKDDDENNGHVWTSIDDYINQVQYVSSQLQSVNPENKDKYAANEKAYVEKLNKLKDDYKDKLSKIAGKKALVLDETMPSFCVFTKLQEIDIKTDHDEESISAEVLKQTIADMKKDNIKAVLITKGSDKKNAEAIAKETGAKIYELNSCMIGNVNENAYLDGMKENFDIISKME